MLKSMATLTRPSKRPRTSPTTTSNHLPSFLRYLSTVGAIVHPNVTFVHSLSWGNHVMATAPIKANTPIFRLPLRLCITSDTAKAHPTIGTLLLELQQSSTLTSLDFDRACVFVQLMYEHYLGEASPHAAYIAILPSLTEMEERIATTRITNSIQTRTKSKCLMGTHIENSIVPKHMSLLDCIYQDVIVKVVKKSSRTHPTLAAALTYNQLVWAAGIFHSRAIMIPGENRSSHARCEALTPLIDLLNHRPGYLSELQRPPMLAESNTTTSRALQKQDVVVYTVGRTIQANEQIFLNYGPKSNEDLLAHFGFCLDKNICDVLRIEITPSAPGTASATSTLLLSQEIVLYEGCHLGKALDVCREVVSDGLETTANEVVYKQEQIKEDDDGEVALSSSAAWFAQMTREEEDRKNGVVWIDLSTIGTPRSKMNENDALIFLENILIQQEKISATAGNDVGEMDVEGVAFKADANTYKKGLNRVTTSVLSQVRAMVQQLI